jgi:hypothetical protein
MTAIKCYQGQKLLLWRRSRARTRRNCSARFSGYYLAPRTDIRRRLRTMNGLSSYFEYGRDTGFTDASPCPRGPARLSSEIWDMTYVNDGYGGTIRARIAEVHDGREVGVARGNRIRGKGTKGKRRVIQRIHRAQDP